MSDQLFLPTRRRSHRARTGATVISLAALITTSLALPAQAANSNPAPTASAAFNTQYAKQGTTVTLTVTTTETTCVDVSGAFTGHQTSSTAKSSWTFTTTAGAGDGAQAVTVVASEKFNGNGICNGQQSASTQASYILDNTGPTVTGTLTPAPNAAGWNKDNVGISWSATDAGSGVQSLTPTTDSVTSDTGGVTKTAVATDKLGNTGNGSVLVKLDKTNPTVTGSWAPAPNTAGWNNTNVTVSLACDDALSGVKSCTGGGSVVVSTEGANQSVNASAVDNADNSAPGSVSGINIDKTAPSLTGTPTTAANGDGWYKGDVTIGWDASDALSGLATGEPTNSTITGEGSGLKATASVSDKAGNTTTSDSAAVKIDRTAPTTGISGTSNNWTNGDVTVSLSSSDNLSGVDFTSYAVDGGATQTGTTFTLSSEGDHTVTFFSTDKAGNAEKPQTAHVKIDKTAPTIGHSFTPLSYTDGAWTNEDVTVTFNCDDTGSGVASCSAPVTKSDEGAAQQVTGSATDNAGNSASNTAVVSIDKTKPTITAAPDRAANEAGWYKDDVTVNFTAGDALSGVANVSAPKVLGEGTDQSATGTATDAAGNSASDTVAGINVDKTAPVLNATFSSGWHTDEVVVTWSCTDARSGVATGPANDTVTGEGDDLSSTATCTDKAGNTATKTVSGIKIDRTAPSTTAAVPAPLASGWYADAVKVKLTGHDTLSGIGATYYRVDGGAVQLYDGEFDFATKGQHTISYWSKDVAGNTEDATGNLTLKIDGNAPTTTVINPISPATGWFVTSGIPVAFKAADAESGIAATYYQIDGGDPQTYGEPFTQDLSTGTHTIAYWSVDLAGNAEAKKTTQVNVDTVPPVITGSRTPAANTYGWNNTDVNVSFNCTDANSGLDTVVACGPNKTVSSQGEGQEVVGTTKDIAGNTNAATVGNINIDKTAPGLTGAPTTRSNAAGWYKGDVNIAWTGTDSLSGIDPLTQPDDSTIVGEGNNLGASAKISDKAGNEGNGSVSGVKIDRTAPVVTGAPTTNANGDGWYRGSVVVDFKCTDNLSGVAVCPTSKSISGDGADQSVTSDPATDVAGNDSAGKTVGGINIDSQAPSTVANNNCTAVNDWCTGSTADVVLTATDQAGLSGVKEIHYKVDNDDEQVAGGASKTVTVPLDGTGEATVTFWSVDKAGNVEGQNSVALRWDNIAPTVTHTVAPAPNAAGWNKSDTTVTFDAKDDDKGSGVAKVTEPVTVSTETAGRVVNGSATDTAGNVGTDKATVKLDKTAPAITGAIVSGTKGNNGWYVGPVKVHFTCDDNLSGVLTCADDVVLTDNGINSASGAATDKAGNTATTTVSGIKIDETTPTTTAVVPAAPASGWYAAAVKVTLNGDDEVSGVDKTYYKVDNGTAQEYTGAFDFSTVGSHTVTYWSEDKAGNVEDAAGNSLTLKVDTVAPGIEGARTPVANKHGWNHTDVDVTFTCSDAESGPASCSPKTTVSDEGADQQVVGNAKDVAGNTSSATVGNINIDKTAPGLTGAPTTAGNAAGWYKGDVKIHWTGSDELSGIDTATQPLDSTIVGEGNNLGASAKISDKAGNEGSGSVSGVKIDRTAPVVTGAPTTSPNGDGWYKGQVVVGFDCTDNLSGVASCPSDKVVSGDGADQTVTSDPATDLAGNASAGKPVGGINIDSQAPSTLANNLCTAVNGWCKGGKADVVLTAADQVGLSGVKEIHYKVDNGTEQVAAADSKTVSVPLDGSGKAAVTFWSVDKAGNIEGQNSVALKWDNIAPTVTHKVTPTPNAAGWNKSDTMVTFAATDDDKGSGVATVTEPVTVADETAVDGQLVNGSASDTAGNVGTDSVTVKLDKTAPTITGAIVDGKKGNNGWYVGPVKVHFTCNDNLSGVAACAEDMTLTANGINSASGSATDEAGNTATTTVGGIKIDQTAPKTTIVVPEEPTSGWYAEPVLVTLTGTDAVSGVAKTFYQVDEEDAQEYTGAFNFGTIGTHTIKYWSVDNAGNVEAATDGITLNVDTVAPGIQGARTPDANKYGWNNSAVDVTFDCSDSDSGVAGCSPKTTVSNEGAGQKVVGDAQDVAGNKNSAFVDNINIDKTAPVLTGAPTTPSNAAGWYKGDVQIKWTGTDGLSGIDPETQPANSTITGEGNNLGAKASISDKAGNETTTSVNGVKIDRTAPVVTGAPTTNPNEFGWYNGKVVVGFSCDDNLSGVAACPSNKVVAGDGANQSVASDPATDNAGNNSAGTTVGGINIDGTAPSTTANNQCTIVNGWCTGDTANVVLTATDQVDLSGVKEIHYKVNGGTEQVVRDATANATVTLTGSGDGTVTYWSVDKAGNVETARAVALKWDNIAPTVTHTLSPAANANEWSNSDTTVTFTAKDDDKGSGVANVSAPVTVSTETAGQVVNGSATDTAGNVGTDKVTVKLDKTAPTIGAIVSGTKGNNGWYTGPVTVHFNCDDNLSGIATCPDDVTLNNNGANSASGTVTDNAGNSATAAVSGINIDQEKPLITEINVANGFYTLGAVPAATCKASDTFSGLAGSCTVTVTGGTPNGVGTFNYTATAVDKAGNTTTEDGTFKVVYRYDGFLQPINDTAHQVGTTTSVFKAGSTVPVKLQLKKSNGTVVPTNAAPVWLTPVKGSAMSAPVDESVYTVSADSGSTYRYDSSAQQYIYNWKTPNAGGNYYRIGVTLDDGQTYYVNIGLKG